MTHSQDINDEKQEQHDQEQSQQPHQEKAGAKPQGVAQEFSQLVAKFKKTPEQHGSHQVSPKSYHVALMFSLLFGFIGLDRFYVGKIGTALIKCLTLGGLGIWWLIDFYALLVGAKLDVNGKKLAGHDYKNRVYAVFLLLWSHLLGGHYFYLHFKKLGLIRVSAFAGLIVSIALSNATGSAYQNNPFFAFVAFVLFVALIVWMFLDLYLLLSERLDETNEGLPITTQGRRHQSIALVFAIIGGVLALDRFYLGHRTLAMIKLVTFGGLYLWIFIDIILIVLNAVRDVNDEAMIQG